MANLKSSLDLGAELKCDYFNRVIIRDSTCGPLPNSLNKLFPGSYSHSKGRSATMRIQFGFDVKSEDILLLKLSSYSDNDQANACAIIDQLEERDLCMDDLGYFKIEKFAQIIEKGAFFISRFKSGTNVYGAKVGDKIDLYKIAKDLKKNKIKQFDKVLYLGSEHRLKIRLVMIRVPQAIANERRRKAREDRHKKANHSKEYLEMLDWTIFITNIPAIDFSPLDLLNCYKLRWRIEIIFKLWKQCLNFEQLLGNKAIIKNIDYVHTIIYAFLLYVTVVILPTCKKWKQIIWEHSQKYLSYDKFINYILTPEGHKLIFDKNETQDKKILKLLDRYCTYERRRDRLNYYEELDAIINNLKSLYAKP